MLATGCLCRGINTGRKGWWYGSTGIMCYGVPNHEASWIIFPVAINWVVGWKWLQSSSTMDLAEFTILSLSKPSALCLIAASSFVAHLAFNRLEPRDPAALLALLIIIPEVLSTILLPHFNHWIFAILTALSTYYVVLSFSLITYRLSPFHPLARYPGATLDKISMIWVVCSSHVRVLCFFWIDRGL